MDHVSVILQVFIERRNEPLSDSDLDARPCLALGPERIEVARLAIPPLRVAPLARTERDGGDRAPNLPRDVAIVPSIASITGLRELMTTEAEAETGAETETGTETETETGTETEAETVYD